ncbi:hypothetical protein [Nocardioides luteus]|uniref:Uncharacterized protein n=1 Tax=Nocardioides luteus TaxID=1844 RepID=A0A1J4N6F6_9ACTN|nr:hypothetical protein [Nocardioides luteus]OIJ27098.1 hypothetical protein UG56_008485 [Nocardioides luteus]
MTTTAELIETSRVLEQASQSLARDTLWSPENLTPAAIGAVLANIATLAATLPQILEQLSRSLEQALTEQFLQVEDKTDASEPARLVDAACDLLAQGRATAVDLHGRIHGAHDQIAPLI